MTIKFNKLLLCWFIIICSFTASAIGKQFFSPNMDGIKDTAVFKLQISTAKENISRWMFEIKDSSGEVVRTFKGDGPAPDKIVWDGKSENQFLVSDGVYTYTFTIITKAGNEVTLSPQEIVVDRTNPSASVSVDVDSFSPNDDGVRDKVTFFMERFDINGINNQLLVIEDKNNNVVKSLLGIKDTMTWDGKGDFEEDVPDGTYNYCLIVQDNAGNRFRTPTQKIQVDREAVVSSIEVDKVIFSPNEDGVKDILEVKINVPENASIDNWKLSILNSVGKVVQSFYGEGEPYHKITWDGKDKKKKTVKDGTYHLVLAETDKAGNTVATVPVAVEVDNSPPTCRIGLDNKLFSPNDDNVLDDATISLKITDAHYLEWKLSILDDVGKLVKIFAGKGENPEESLVWDGKDDNKRDVIDGNFTYLLEATDIAGNKYRTSPGSIQIDRTPPVINAEASLILFSPNKDGIMDETSFIFKIRDASPLDHWKLEIKDSSRETVKVFKDKINIEGSIQWDGKGDSKRTLPDGTYSWTVEAVDMVGNSSKISPQKIVIGATRPTISVKPDLDIFSPNADGFKDSVKFSLEVSAFNRIKEWKLKIIKNKDEAERTYTGLGNPPPVVSWFGEKDNKKPLPDGKYSYTFEVTDEVGNYVATPLESIVIDNTKPQVSVSVQPAIFSPNGDEFKDKVSFVLEYRDESSAEQWDLEIEDYENKICRKFSDKGNPPFTIVWEGKDKDGNILKDGIYNYLLRVQDIVGNSINTTRKILKIDNTPPHVQLSVEPTLFSPNNDGVKDTTTFYLDYRDASDIAEWILKITGPEPALKTFKGIGRPSQIISWDGKNNRDNILPDGVYNAVLSIKDEVGNEGKSPSIQIKIDTFKPVVSVVTEEEPVSAFIPMVSISKETDRGMVISLAAELLFALAEEELKPEAKVILNKVAHIIKKYPDRKISVEGHTCDLPIHTPRFPNNQVLSEERTKSVLRYFVEELKLSPDRFTTKGFGDTKPITSNATEEGRRKNRRVEIILVK